MPDSPRIYVSYRRSDTGLASRFLTDKLATYFGTDRVFSDIDSIEPGEDFSEAIAAAIRSCSVLLVVIGSSWLSVVGEGARRRLDDPDDVVRTEIEAGLTYGLLTVPVLIDDAIMPSPAELPSSLMPLARRSAFSISSRSFDYDTARLIEELDRTSEGRPEPLPPTADRQEATVPRSLIFVSYSHHDDQWLERLQVHLRPLARQGGIDLWDDTRIRAGDEWRREIEEAIEVCKVAVLVVTADFMASDFIDSNELPPLLQAAKQRGVRIISVLASSSNFEDTELARYQAINSPSKPLDMLPRGEQEAVFVKLYKEIRNSLRL
jgi:nucleotide-binding universal stress UspA family protein